MPPQNLMNTLPPRMASRTRSAAFQEALWGWFFIAPFILLACVFLVGPVVYSVYLSFRETGLYASWFDEFGDMKFVGLGNYRDLLTSPVFWYSILATFLYAALYIPSSIAAALALALALNRKRRQRIQRLFRSLFFLPHVFDVFVLGVIWLLLFNPAGGPLAAAFRFFGVSWFTENGFVDNPITILPSIAFAMVLKSMGFGMVLFLTALHSIPESIFEAADIDGASGRQKLFLVTIPLLKPMILFLVVTGLVGVLNGFTEFYALTNATGGPAFSFFGETVQAARVSGFHMFRYFDESFYGHAAAMSFLMLGLALIVAGINWKFLGRE